VAARREGAARSDKHISGGMVTGSPAEYQLSLAAFRDGLKALSYIEGQNITIEYRWVEGNVARLSELARDLVDRKVVIILAGGVSSHEGTDFACQSQHDRGRIEGARRATCNRHS
jgi:hypothetical protein